MKKQSLLYASPFPPMKSGIADYSVVLVKALAEYFDITLYTDAYDMDEKSLESFPIIKKGKDRVSFESFDYILYNMGNNPMFHSYMYPDILEHPGVVILHDVVLYHFVREYYRERQEFYTALYRNFGVDSFIAVKDALRDGYYNDMSFASSLPLNEEILKAGNKIIVHSHYAEKKVLESGCISPNSVRQVNLILQVEEESEIIPREVLFEKYNVPKDAFLICSLGYIMSTKHNLEISRVIRKMQQTSERKICYVMVGDGTYADSELEKNTVIKTGYTTLEEFNSFAKYADVIVNLRYPSLGETSAAMLRILQMGKPCITNNGGWFSEIPDNCVRKIEIDNLEENLETALRELMDDPGKAQFLGERAGKYAAEEYSGSVIAERMYRFIANC